MTMSEKQLLLPVDSAHVPTRRRATHRRWQALALGSVAAMSVIGAHRLGYLSLGHDHLAVDESKIRDLCTQPHPARKPSNWSELYTGDAFAKESAERLAGAIRVPTQNFDDMGPADKDPRWQIFGDLRDYLRKTFPTVHARADLQLVQGISMVFTLEGQDKSLKPMMLTAHQDVVPAVTSLDRWTYPPFEGVVEGGFVYGRGASDCKNNLIGIMTSLEYMLSNGWTPQRTFILAFGHDEETGGAHGATSVNEHLQNLYGKDGIAMIVDEGGMGLDSIYGAEFALPGMAEKGYGNFVIEVDTLGGHSSVPRKYTSIGMLSKVISEIEDRDLFQPDLQTSSPMYGYMQCAARYGKRDVPKWIKSAVSSKHPDLKAAGNRFAEVSPANRYLIETSKAVTIIHGGNKVNALPEAAVATINSRIDSYSNAEEVAEVYRSVMKDIATKYSLLVDGKRYGKGEPIGNMSLNIDDSLPPSGISPVESAAFNVFAKAVQASFGPEVITAPSAMTGNTDTRHYANLTKHIYRWSPVRNGGRFNAHTVDEKLKVDAHVEGIKFYTELIVAADEMGAALN